LKQFDGGADGERDRADPYGRSCRREYRDQEVHQDRIEDAAADVTENARNRPKKQPGSHHDDRENEEDTAPTSPGAGVRCRPAYAPQKRFAEHAVILTDARGVRRSNIRTARILNEERAGESADGTE
jgi:hypothetical protein